MSSDQGKDVGHFGLTNKGAKLLIDSGHFSYTKSKISPDGKTSYWICSKKVQLGCPARVSTTSADNESCNINKRTKEHSHLSEIAELKSHQHRLQFVAKAKANPTITPRRILAELHNENQPMMETLATLALLYLLIFKNI